MSETRKVVAATAVVTTILLLMLILVVNRGLVLPWKDDFKNKTITRPLTFRISGIPRSITKDTFRDILTTLDAEMSTKADKRHGLLGFSYARTAAAAQLSRSFVATATFRVPVAPSELELAIKRKMNEINIDPGRLRVDLDFFGLTPLADGEESSAVDIIAVTGLAGHAFGSWKSRGEPHMWLRDFLPESISNARILIYGYDTKLPGSQSTASILELSKRLLESVKTIRIQDEKYRPLIFIAHSLGGLVVKQALVEAAKGSQDDRAIFMSCYAVMFFGVPNRGLDISNLPSMVKGQPNEDLVRYLDPSSSFLSMLHEIFYNLFILEDSEIISIFETKMTPTVEWSPKTGAWERTGQMVMMVPQPSAIHAGKNEKPYDRLPINANHSNIVKFSHHSDEDYLIIESRIKQLVASAPRVMQRRIASHRKRLSEIEVKYLKALNAPDYAAFRNHKVEDPAPGTCQWFLENKSVQLWLDKDEFSILWVRGSPGQGKTVLSKFLLNHLEKLQSSSNANTKAIYFFFYDQDERLRTVSGVLRSLIKQLLTTIDLQYNFSIFDLDSFKDSDTLWEILEAMIHDPTLGKVYCVLDALDECSEDESGRGFLLRRFKRLFQTSTQKQSPVLKLFITSRPIMAISRELESCPYIDLKANPNDLKIFIASKVKYLSNDMQSKAAELLLCGAGRTFLWVSIILKELRTTPLQSLAKLRDIIESSPADLYDLYGQITDRIMQGTPEEQKLLAWVVYSRRPLTLRELEAALATQIDSKNKKSTEDHRIDLTSDAVTSAAGVILEITDGKVHLIHQSAKDFLLQNQQLKSAGFCKNQDPNTYLAKICMTYLSFEDFETGPCGDLKTLAERKSHYPLFHYAACNWYAHIRSADDITGFSHIIYRLTKPQSQILLSWGEAARIQDLHDATDLWGVATKANIAWLAEFQPSNTIITKERVKEVAKNFATGYSLMETIVSRGDAQFTEGAVLELASIFNEEMIKLLLNSNNNIKVTHAMIKAAAGNRKSGTYVMRLLLDRCDDVVLTADLVEAAVNNEESSEDVIKMLLYKQDITITEGAVIAIARQFDAKIVRLLLEKREGIKITNEVMEAAATNRHSEELIPLLLDGEREIKISGTVAEDIMSLLDEYIINLMLNEGTEIEITEKMMIRAAAENYGNQEEIMTLLLDRGGEITEEVLKAAVASWSRKEMMTLLLDRGGEITEEEMS